MIWTEWAITILRLVRARFARNVVVLILPQRALYSLGVAILYSRIIVMLNEWFVAKKGLALELMTAATGFSGIVMPFVLAVLLDRYEFEVTPRLSLFLPTLYLPSYSSDLGCSPAVGALLLALFSLPQVSGQTSCGHFADHKVSVEMLSFVFLLILAASIFTLCGLGRSSALLFIFSLLYGFCDRGYVVLWAKMGSELSDVPTVALTTIRIFAFLKGVGIVIIGTISAALSKPQKRMWQYAVGRYG